jgi:hypothetical protein
MDSLRSMNNALAYIEEHLTEYIDYSKISKITYCSEVDIYAVGFSQPRWFVKPAPGA